MDNGIDASLGLDVTLTVLSRLRKGGVLRAEVSSLPGRHGQYHCVIEFVEGQITSCVIEDAAGRRQNIDVRVIIAADHKKGPFSWSFHPLEPLPNFVQTSPLLPAHSGRVIITDQSIPIPLKRIVDLQWLNNLEPHEKMIASWVFSLVDGRRTIAEIIKYLPRLRADDIRRALQFMKRMGAIEFANH